jgi:hypothetical protein
LGLLGYKMNCMDNHNCSNSNPTILTGLVAKENSVMKNSGRINLISFLAFKRLF